MKKYFYQKYVVLLFFLCCTGSPCFSQGKKIVETSLITGKKLTIRVKGDYKDVMETRTRKNYMALYTRKSEGLLLGNKCAEDAIRSYDFTYQIVPRNHNISGAQYFFHNWWTNTRLFFKNGPFWKSRLRKKIADCREATHDYVID